MGEDGRLHRNLLETASSDAKAAAENLRQKTGCKSVNFGTGDKQGGRKTQTQSRL